MTYHRNPDASTPVHNGAGPVAWSALSLLAEIGTAQRWVVRLRVVSDGGDQYADFRPGDNTSILSPLSQALRGCAGGRQTGIYCCTYQVFTDASAEVDWITSGGGSNFTVYLEGWHDATPHDPAAAGPADAAAAVLPAVTWGAPAPFQSVDFNLQVGKEERLVILEYAYNGGTGNDRSFYVRPVGGALLPHRSNGYAPRGPSNAQLRNINPVQVAAVTDTNGQIEQAQWFFAATCNIWVHGYLDDWRPSSGALKSGKPPTSFGTDDIDLSATIPVGGVARFLVTRPDAIDLGTLISLAFRNKGATLDTSHGGSLIVEPRACEYVVLDASENAYVDVEVPPGGLVEWEASVNTYNIDVALIGFDPEPSDPPTVTNERPEGPALGELAEIGCTIRDGWGLDTTTLSLVATPPTGEGLVAISGGAVQTGWSGRIVEIDDVGAGPRTIEIIIDGWPDLVNGARWTFTISIDSNSGQSL